MACGEPWGYGWWEQSGGRGSPGAWGAPEGLETQSQELPWRGHSASIGRSNSDVRARSRSGSADARSHTGMGRASYKTSRSLRGSAGGSAMADHVRRQLTQCEAEQILKVAGRSNFQVDVAGAAVALQRLARDVSFRANGKDRRINGLLQILQVPLLRGDGASDVRQFISISWALARLSVTDEPLLDALTAEALPRISELSCQALASTSWAFAKLEAGRLALAEPLSTEAFLKLHEFSNSQLASMSWAVAKMQEVGEPLMNEIASRTQFSMHELSLRDLSSVAWSLANMRLSHKQLMHDIASRAVLRISELSALDFTNLSWAFVETGMQTDEFIVATSIEIRHRLSSLGPQDLGRWLWAFAKAGVESAELLEALGDEVVSKAGSLQPHDITALLWSLSRQGAGTSKHLVGALAEETVKRVGEFGTQQLATAACAFSRLSWADAPVLGVLLAAARAELRHFAPSDLASLAWTAAQVGDEYTELLGTLASEALRRGNEFSPHDLASFAAACATLVHQDRELMQSIATGIMSNAESLTAQDISRMCWACSKMFYFDEELLGALTSASLERMGEFQTAHLANVIWSCAKLTNKNEQLIDALCGTTMGRIAELNAQNLANTVWAIATLNFTITEKMEAFIEYSIQKIREFGPQGLANTSWAFAKMEQKFDDLMQAITEEAKAKMGEFETQNLSNTAWAFATLRIEDGELMKALSEKTIERVDECTCRDLASTSWAFARIHMPNPSLVASLSVAVVRHMNEFEAKGLSNTAWAFSMLGAHDGKLLNAIAGEVMQKIDVCWADGSLKIEDLATDLNGLTWAMQHADLLADNLSSTILAKMRGLGRAKDLEMSSPSKPPPAQIEKVSPEDHPGDAPILRDDWPDMCCIHKPAGWEVDNQDAGGGPWMSSWLMEQFSIDDVPIVHYEEHQFGMVQRLDIPSSGLILVGKTWEGFYTLKWQLQTGGITRDYVLLVHGWIELDSRINDQSFAEKAAEGEPAPAQLTVLAHLRRADEEDAKMSLVVMRVQKSKRSDLRLHFAGAGHPTVADGKYSDRETYLRDREWCARKFMHCFQLHYRDSKDSFHQCLEPLPSDLRESLAKLLPRGPESAEAVEEWLDGQMPRPWDEYAGLQGNDEA